MTWSYDASLIDETTAVGRRTIVRLLIGDTNTNDQQLQNEEIDYYLDTNDDSIRSASIDAVRGLIAKYARDVDKWMGHTRVDLSSRVRAYERMLVSMLNDSSGLYIRMMVASSSVDTKDSYKEDTSLVQPSFTIGQDDEVSVANNIVSDS